MGRYAYNPITGKLDRVGSSGDSGAVIGPGSSTDNDIVIFDGLTGKLVKDTGISSINPTFAGNLTAQTFNLPLSNGTDGYINMAGFTYVHSTGGLNNFFAGPLAGNNTTTSDGSTGIGRSALAGITSGISNTALGHVAGDTISTGSSNTAIGEGSMFQCGGAVTGNTGLGWHSLIVCQGNYNVGLGFNVMGSGVSGQQNIGIGYFSMSGLLTGSFNTSMGPQSGMNYTGAESNNLCLNNLGVTGESNTTRLGNVSSTDCFLYGVANKLITNDQVVVVDPSTQQLGIVPGKPTISFKAPTESLIILGPHVLFTPARDFIVTGVFVRTVSAAGAAGDSQCSLGFNAPLYTNLISGGMSFATVSDEYDLQTLNNANNPVLPSGTPLVLNVLVIDSSATAFDVDVYITGVYA